MCLLPIAFWNMQIRVRILACLIRTFIHLVEPLYLRILAYLKDLQYILCKKKPPRIMVAERNMVTVHISFANILGSFT